MSYCRYDAQGVCTQCGHTTAIHSLKRECGVVTPSSLGGAVAVAGCHAGTALTSMLSRIGITSEPGCACRRHAAEMDARGCDWCEQNIDTVVGWLREEAAKRGLPFLDAAGRMLVRLAVRRARASSATARSAAAAATPSAEPR
jgi:hypothetical protein